MVHLYPEFFNDVFGPIMQPGSSSHTAGPCRLGYMANSLLGESPAEMQFILDPGGSFASTFGIMQEDLGMLSGAMGMLPDDVRIFQAYEIIQEQGVKYSFKFQEIRESKHYNALKIILTGRSGKTATLVGDSTGGGMIETQVLNGFPLRAKGDSYVLLIFDYKGELSEANLSQVRHCLKDLIAEGCIEQPDHGRMFYFKVPELPDLISVREAAPEMQVEMLKAILPVVTWPGKKAQLFDSMTRWRQLAEEMGSRLSDVAIQYEENASLWRREKVIEYMQMVQSRMHMQTHAHCTEDGKYIVNSFNWRDALRWEQYQNNGILSGEIMAEAIKMALVSNSKIIGVEVVPGPMGMGGGLIYSALYAVKQSRGYSDEDLLRGLFVAGGVGAIAYTRSNPTGEILGCTGECGICSSMAAAAITEMASGTPEQVENAASLSLQSSIGIPCDPIPSEHDQPCMSRAIAAVCMAIVFADLALSGKGALLPYHEVLDVADRVGRGLPNSLRCTSTGGCCSAPTAKKEIDEFHIRLKKLGIKPTA